MNKLSPEDWKDVRDAIFDAKNLLGVIPNKVLGKQAKAEVGEARKHLSAALIVWEKERPK